MWGECRGRTEDGGQGQALEQVQAAHGKGGRIALIGGGRFKVRFDSDAGDRLRHQWRLGLPAKSE